MSHSRRLRLGVSVQGLVFVAFTVAAVWAATASAQSGTAQASHGGVSAPGDPVVSSVVCKTQCLSPRTAVPGAVVKVKGESLEYVEHAVFRGASGPMPVPLTYRDAVRVRAIVPQGALSSRPYVVDERGKRSNRSPRRLKISAAAALPSYLFPIRGPHTYGDGFGAPRGGRTHQGQDLPAACGTTLAASAAGKVKFAGYQRSAGNYLVLDVAGSYLDLVYMHMLETPYVRTHQSVGAVQIVGKVGNTGHSFGCHLHFEIWRGGWYDGGKPIDPISYLKQWDKTS